MLNVKEILKIYLIEQRIYPNHQDEGYIYHSDLSWYVSDCTVHSNKGIIVFIVNWSAWSFLSGCHS